MNMTLILGLWASHTTESTGRAGALFRKVPLEVCMIHVPKLICWIPPTFRLISRKEYNPK
jgi:hypothetical protein